ncbi:MAG: response regulator, partial [Sphingomonadaceae bacterium]|nr:response regulator [Sphingomonadaceae bacterium]
GPLSILVVEDEAPVARAVASLLEREGHRVTVVRSAEDAVAKLESGDAEFSVILSDYRMPGMGGEGLAQWLRTEHPEWMDRLVIASGDVVSRGTEAFLEAAVAQLAAALDALAIEGLETTAGLYVEIARDPRFIAGGVDALFFEGLARG